MVKITPEVSVEISANAPRFFSTLKKAQADLNDFGKTFKNVAGTIGIGFGVQQVISFGLEVARLGGETQAVSAAFNRLNDAAALMKNLKEITGGTVSELDLMKRTVQAANFGISLKQLPELLQFATLRAQQTGQSVDYLVESIIMGIGRKSPMILDNLGISLLRIREKLKGVGSEAASVADFTRIIGEIAREELGKMPGFSENAATSLQRISAVWANIKSTIGQIGDNSGILVNTAKLLTNILELIRKINSLGDKGVGFSKSKQEEQLKIGLTGSAPTIQEAFNAGILDKLIKAQFVSASQGNKSFFEKALGTEFGQRQALGAIIDPVKSKGINYIVTQTGKAYKEFAQILKDNNYTVEETNIVWNRFIEISREAYFAEKQRIAAEKAALTLEEQKKKAKELADFLAQKELERKEHLLKLNKYEREDLKLSIEQNERFNQTLRERLGLSNAAISAEMMGMQSPETGKLGKPAGMQAYVDYAKAVLWHQREMKISAEDLDQAFSNAAKGGLLDFASGLQDVFKNEISFGDNILRALAGFLQEFGKQLIVLGTGQIMLSETIKEMFSGNPAAGAAAVAAGITMMAIGGAVQSGVQARMQKLAETRGGSNVNNFNRSNEIKITGQLVGSGSDLIAVINNASFDNKIRKGG